MEFILELLKFLRDVFAMFDETKGAEEAFDMILGSAEHIEELK